MYYVILALPVRQAGCPESDEYSNSADSGLIPFTGMTINR